MHRLAAILSVCLLAVASPALAAQVTFIPQKNGSSITRFDCVPPAPLGGCGLERPKIAFDDAEDGDYRADPLASFRFLEFNARDGRDRDDSNGTGTGNDENDERASGSFTTSVKLLLRIKDSKQKVTLISTGRGRFETEDDEITAFSLIWDPIANFVIPGKGPFAVAFENIDSIRSSRFKDGEYDKDEDGKEDWQDDVYISASITPVPLPAGAWLLLSGLGLLGAARLRRRLRV